MNVSGLTRASCRLPWVTSAKAWRVDWASGPSTKALWTGCWPGSPSLRWHSRTTRRSTISRRSRISSTSTRWVFPVAVSRLLTYQLTQHLVCGLIVKSPGTRGCGDTIVVCASWGFQRGGPSLDPGAGEGINPMKFFPPINHPYLPKVSFPAEMFLLQATMWRNKKYSDIVININLLVKKSVYSNVLDINIYYCILLHK